MTRRAAFGKTGTPRYDQTTVFYLLVMITLTQMSHVASGRSWVKIWNNIGPDQRLWVACYYVLLTRGHKKPVTLGFDEVYYFRFQQVRLVKTRWWCTFEWENTHRNQTITVWDHTEGSPVPVYCSQCLWAARTDGWYVWDKVGEEFIFYKPWLDSVMSPHDRIHNSSQMFGFSQKRPNDSLDPALAPAASIEGTE